MKRKNRQRKTNKVLIFSSLFIVLLLLIGGIFYFTKGIIIGPTTVEKGFFGTYKAILDSDNICVGQSSTQVLWKLYEPGSQYSTSVNSNVKCCYVGAYYSEYFHQFDISGVYTLKAVSNCFKGTKEESISVTVGGAEEPQPLPVIPTEEPPTKICTSDFSDCSTSNCISGEKTTTCIDVNHCDSTKDKVVETINCESNDDEGLTTKECETNTDCETDEECNEVNKCVLKEDEDCTLSISDCEGEEEFDKDKCKCIEPVECSKDGDCETDEECIDNQCEFTKTKECDKDESDCEKGEEFNEDKCKCIEKKVEFDWNEFFKKWGATIAISATILIIGIIALFQMIKPKRPTYARGVSG